MFGEFVHTVQKIAKNTIITILGNIVFRAISLFITIYLARYLGTEDFGKYSFVFAYLAFFTVLADLGLRQILVREMSRNISIAPKLMGNAYIITLLLTIFATILSMVIITLLAYPSDITTYVYIAAFTVVAVSFSEFYSTIFQVDFKMEYNILAKTASKILAAILILWIIFSEGALILIIISVTVSEMVKMLLSYSFSKKFIKPKIEIDSELCKHLLKESLPLALISCIWIIYFRIDVVMLSIVKGNTSVGLYSAAYNLFEPFSLIPYALTISLFPIMSAAFKTSEERIVKSYRLGIKYLLSITLPIAIGTTLLAERIIFLVYGSEFSGSATTLQILMWALVFTSLSSISLKLLVSIDRQKLNILIMGSGVVINIALNLLLIPILSYNGAAIATVVSNLILFIVGFYLVSNYLQVPHLLKMLLKPIISGLIMGIFIFLFLDINIFAIIFLATIVYSVVLLSLKTFSAEDWEIFKKILNFKKL